MNSDNQARLRVAALIYLIVNAVVFGVGLITVLMTPNSDAARLLLDTRDHRDQFRFVSTTGMVHSPIDDDAFHPGPPRPLTYLRQGSLACDLGRRLGPIFAPGQTEKNSLRANVFRVTPETDIAQCSRPVAFVPQ